MSLSIFHEHGADGEEDDLPVHPEAALLDVFQIQRHPLVKAHLVTVGCDLPVAAQSGGDVQPLALVVAVQLYLPGQCGARPHDAHIALQHVEHGE